MTDKDQGVRVTRSIWKLVEEVTEYKVGDYVQHEAPCSPVRELMGLCEYDVGRKLFHTRKMSGGILLGAAGRLNRDIMVEDFMAGKYRKVSKAELVEILKEEASRK